MQYAMEDLVVAFEEETGTPCDVVLGSSGKLYAQLTTGAPYHVFVSADMEHPEALYRQGLTAGIPKVYAMGKLVLLSRKKASSLASALAQPIKHCAVPNPQVAPYGVAALEFLKSEGYYDTLQDKLVFGENVAQTAQFLQSGAADIAIVSQSLVHAVEEIESGSWFELPINSHGPLLQGSVVVHQPELKDEAQAFHQFLSSKKAKEILNTFGYQAAP